MPETHLKSIYSYLTIFFKKKFEKNIMKDNIAICGLECDKCEIYLVDEDEGVADGVLEWFMSEGWRPESMTVQEFMQEGKLCLGCRTTDRHSPIGRLSSEIDDFLQQQVTAREISQDDYTFFQHRPRHWNAGCRILLCCVDEKTLNSCHECPDFVCERLEEWTGSSGKYAQAVERLKELRECAQD
jgi:hypothetical protein